MKGVFLFILIMLLVAAIPAQTKTSYRAEIEKWRAEHETEIKKDNGWLTVVGLFWLKTGKNTVGAGSGYDIELTDNFKAGKFGEIDFSGGKAVLTVADGVNATANGKPARLVDLTPDEKGKGPTITTGSQSFFVIKREDRVGVRLKDSNSKARREFTHLNWFEIDPKLRINAKFEKYETPKEVLVPNVLGGEFKMTSPGVVKFKLGDKDFAFETIDEGEGQLFIIFRDLTSRTETYGAGRFLYADWPVGDTVVLDFNKAENPPCAFTEYATCPLPPQQNRLQIEIKAGEKRYGKSKGK